MHILMLQMYFLDKINLIIHVSKIPHILALLLSYLIIIYSYALTFQI
jgi:hypothetical protein